MWTLIKSWWASYIDLIENSYLIDEAYMELGLDCKLGRGEW